MRNHYQVLGIPRDASSVDIEAAFRDRMAALAQNPQADPSSRDAIRDAYFVLSSIDRRSDYDESLPPDPRARKKRGEEDRGALAQLLSKPWVMGVGAAMIVIVAVLMWPSAPRVTPPAATVANQAVLADANGDLILTTKPDAAKTEPAAAPTGPRAPTAGTAEEIFGAISPSIARVRSFDGTGAPVGQGSGVVIGSGIVVTNCHVLDTGSNYLVKVGQYEYNAAPYQADPERDLCSLSVAGLDAPAVQVGSVSTVRTGQKVFAIGAPHGLELTISEGIVSALRETDLGTVIQTTAPISPGSSGGGLFNAAGLLVGIVTFQHKYGQNLNFAVPADWIAEMR